MTQLFNVSIDGVSVTSRVTDCTVSEEVNRFYDVATFTIDNTKELILEKNVVIPYGSKTFSGFIYNIDKIGKNSLRVECRSHSAKLTEPYSASEAIFDNASTSRALCALYARKTGIPIINTAANLDFGGSYERNGTILSALSTIASVTGAEYYNSNGKIIIEPNRAITSPGVIIPDRDIFDFIPDTRSVQNNGVGYITIQNGGSVTTEGSSTDPDKELITDSDGEVITDGIIVDGIITDTDGAVIIDGVLTGPDGEIITNGVITDGIITDGVITVHNGELLADGVLTGPDGVVITDWVLTDGIITDSTGSVITDWVLTDGVLTDSSGVIITDATITDLIFTGPNGEIITDGVITDPDGGIVTDWVLTGPDGEIIADGILTDLDGGSLSSIFSQNSIYTEVDECSGEVSVFLNPYAAVTSTKGISPLTAIKLEKKEEKSVLDEDIVTLDGAIESISAVTLNGINITNYNFEPGHNMVYFSTMQRGILSITYIALAHKGYANISITPIGKFMSFDIFYLDQAVSFQGFLSSNCAGSTNSDNSSTDGDMTCIVPSEMMYPKGFTVWTIGGVPEFTFYANNKKIDRAMVSTPQNYTHIEDARFESTVTGYRYRTRYPVISALGVRSAGVDVPYTTSSDADGYYFELTQYYPKVVVSYETAAINHYVQFANIAEAVVSMVIRNTNTDTVCEHELKGIDFSDLSSIPCVLGQNIPVNIAQLLDIPVSVAKGISLSYTRPDSTATISVVDSFGYLAVYADFDGDYVIDTSSLKARTTITLTVNVNG